jgi:hypothetical protein
LSWSVVGPLPDGIALVPGLESATLEGEPLRPGNFAFSVVVSDAAGHSASQELLVHVSSGTFAVVANGLPAKVHPGDAVSATFLAPAGKRAVFSLYSGRMPPGLTLGNDGRLSGAVDPEAEAAPYDFVVQAVDADGDAALAPSSITVVSVPGADRQHSGCSALGGNPALGALALLLLRLIRARRAS